MAKEFSLDAEHYRVEAQLGTNLGSNSLKTVREIMADIEGVRFETDLESGRFTFTTIDPDKSPESIKNEIRQRMGKARHQGIIQIQPEKISFSQPEQILEENENTSVAGERPPLQGVKNFWSRFSDYAENLATDKKSSKKGSELLDTYLTYRAAEDSAAEYILNQTDESQERFWFLLNGHKFEDSNVEDLRTTYNTQIRSAKDDTEYEELWKSILSSLESNKKDYDNLTDNVASLAEELKELNQKGREIEKELEELEKERLPIGWISNGTNRAIIPLGTKSSYGQKVLAEQIDRELNRFTDSSSTSKNFTDVKVDANLDVVYSCLRNASDRLGLDLDYGFVTKEETVNDFSDS